MGGLTSVDVAYEVRSIDAYHERDLGDISVDVKNTRAPGVPEFSGNIDQWHSGAGSSRWPDKKQLGHA